MEIEREDVIDPSAGPVGEEREPQNCLHGEAHRAPGFSPEFLVPYAPEREREAADVDGSEKIGELGENE